MSFSVLQDELALAYKGGNYKLVTQKQRLAACIQTLRNISMVQMAYHSRGPEFQVREMCFIANQLLQQLINREAALGIYQDPSDPE